MLKNTWTRKAAIYQSYVRYVAIILLTISTSAFASDVGRPADLKVHPLDHAASCGALLGGWGGKDPYGRAIEIWIEKVDSACNVQMVYAWGGSPGSQIASDKGSRRLAAIANGTTLTFELKDFGAKGAYGIDGSNLKGIFTNRNGTPIHMNLAKLAPTN